MQVNLQLIRNGWATYCCDNVQTYVRGQAHIENKYYEAETLAKYLCEKIEDNLNATIKKLNGTWAIVQVDRLNETAILVVDHLRSIQLLYKLDAANNTLFISDDITFFEKDSTLEFDEDCLHEYLSSGYVYYNRILYKDVFSLQAAERIGFDKEMNMVSERYYFKQIFPQLIVPNLKDAPFYVTKGNTKTKSGALIGKYTPAFWPFSYAIFTWKSA